MDFGLSEEQELLEESLRRFLEEHLPMARVREIQETELACDPAVWKGLAELGVLGCLIPEVHGGSGLTLLDAALIAQALGHAAAPVPFLGSAVLAAVALREAGTAAQQAEWLPRLAAGDVRISVALSERVAARDDAGVSLSAGRLRGKALFVPDAPSADHFLIPCGEDLWLVSADAPGLEVETLPTIDRTRRVGELRFTDVEPAERIGAAGSAAAAMDRALDAGRIVLAADGLGGCDRALAMAVSYAMDRKQFERPIASFQAVKHMCAEMAATIEPARALLWYSAHAFDASPDEAPLMASLCKSHLSEVGTDVVRTATEVHGGIGFTDEYDLHLWFKRAGLNRQLLGSPEQLRARAAELQAF